MPIWGEDLHARPSEEHLAHVPANATTPGRWVDAGDLRVGDVLLLMGSKPSRVTGIEKREKTQTVFNFSVHELECYAVGNSRVLVHNTNGPEANDKAQPPLEGIHSDLTFNSDPAAKASLEYWRTQSTERLVESLKPGNGDLSLLTKPDGRIMNGNTRIKVLRERGYDVDSLPREILPLNPLDDPFWFEA